MKLQNTSKKVFYVRKKPFQIFSANSLNKLGADKLIGTKCGKGTNNKEIVLKNGFLEICGVGIQAWILNKN